VEEDFDPSKSHQRVFIYDPEEKGIQTEYMVWENYNVYRESNVNNMRTIEIESYVVDEKMILLNTKTPTFASIIAESEKLGVDLTDISLIFIDRLIKTETQSLSNVYYLTSNDTNSKPTRASNNKLVRYYPIKDNNSHLLDDTDDTDWMNWGSVTRQLIVFDHTAKYVHGINIGTLNYGKVDFIAEFPNEDELINCPLKGVSNRKVQDLPDDWLRKNQPIATYLTLHRFVHHRHFQPSISEVWSQLPTNYLNDKNKKYLLRIEPYSENIHEMTFGAYHAAITMVYNDNFSVSEEKSNE